MELSALHALARIVVTWSRVTSILRHRALFGLLLGALVVSVLAVEAPAEAQRSSLRARRARAARVRAQRRATRMRVVAHTSPRSDMDFGVEPLDDERPPPMDLSYVQEAEAERMAARRRMLDPELFGEAGAPGPSSPAAPSEPGRYSPLDARVALRLFNRNLGYRDYARGPVTDYDLPLGAALAVDVDYYPAAHLTNDAWAHLGLAVSMMHSLGVTSTGPGGISYPTTAYAWHVGARYRVPLDEGSELAIEAGAGEHGFRVERGQLQDPAPRSAPAADYDLARFGLSGRFAMGQAALGARVAYLAVFGAGEIATDAYFGGAEVHGVEAGVDFTYDLGLGFAILAAVDLRLFVLSFPASPSAAASAAGALDRTIGANLGLRWTMPSHAAL